MRLLILLLFLSGCASPPSDGPDTTQKFDPDLGYNFGTNAR
jgi:hypothetical protein